MVAARLATMERGRPKINPSIEGNISQTQAAKMLNVSTASVERASKVITDGVLDLAERVESGEISVSRAAEIATQPATRQKRILARRGRGSVVALASKLKVEASLKKARTTHDVCLLCNPAAKEEITQEKFVAFLEVAALKLPGRFARYLLSNIEEIEEMDAADEMPDLYEKILRTIDAGHQTFSEIQKFTRIEKDILIYTLGCMKGASIEQVPQGGKTAAARGGRKMLWQRKQLKNDFRDDEESTGSCLFGLNLGFSL